MQASIVVVILLAGSMTVRPRRFGPGGFDPARSTRGSVVPGELDPGVFDPICFYYFTRNEYIRHATRSSFHVKNFLAYH